MHITQKQFWERLAPHIPTHPERITDIAVKAGVGRSSAIFGIMYARSRLLVDEIFTRDIRGKRISLYRKKGS